MTSPSADADLLRTLGRQAGQALERVWLYEETARQAARSAFLLDAARLMSRPRGRGRDGGAAGPARRPPAGRPLRDRPGDRARLGPPGRPARRPRAPAPGRPAAGGAPAARRGRAPERAGRGRRAHGVGAGVTDAWLARIAQDERHLAVAPGAGADRAGRRPADGRRPAARRADPGLRPARGPFTAADVEVAEQLALQVSQVVDKAQRLELETRTSHTLQANLLPPAPPPVPGLAVAVRYVAASRAPTSAGTSTTSCRCRPTARWPSRSATSSGTTSRPRR